jgi:ferrochelatase
VAQALHRHDGQGTGGEGNAGYFRAGGGENFAAIPCLNDSEQGMRVIETVVLRELQGWM